MATTSLWHISGKLKDLVDYVENPEKTVEKHPELADLWNVAQYVERPGATQDGAYVTAINCLKETALRQMILTKRQYGKEDGYIAYHGYQSFKPGEVTPEECHRIGVETAKELWGDKYQIIVTTHLDKEHLHNHFLFNSVSFRDGRKYNYSKQERVRMMEVSDRICREHGLSWIQHPRKAPSRPVYFAEKNNEPTRYNVYLDDLYDAIDKSNDVRHIEMYLWRLGYQTDFTGKHWKMKLPQYEHFTRLDTLDPDLTPEYIRQNCGADALFGNERAEVTFSPHTPEHLWHVWQPKKHTSKIYNLYLYWCYELGILPKKTQYRPTSPFLREEWRKIDKYSRELEFLAHFKIETLEQLELAIDLLDKGMNELIKERTQLYNKMRRADPERLRELRKQRDDLSDRIGVFRKTLKTARDVLESCAHIDKTLQLVHENEERAEQRAAQPRSREYER